MNIHSSYRKLNDYKGASCGQHSALSTQHSALSTQHLVKLLLLFLLACTSNISIAQQVCKYNLDEVIYPTPLAACKGFQDRVFSPTTTSSIYGLETFVRTNYTGFGLPNTYYIDALCYIHTDYPDWNHGLWINCQCTTGYKMNQAGVCELENGTSLTLTPAPYQNEPRPKEIEGKDGKSTFDLIAKVTENGSPKAGVTVTFASKVEANSGGHDHHDASRPKGDVPASGETDTNGEIKITFQAPLFAGKHTVEATCDSCSNKTVTHSLDVKVLNLTQLTGGGSGTLYKLVGDDGNHGSNHWFSYKAKDALIQLLSIFKEYGWGVVGVNDSSLMWGGCFDVPGRWGACKRNHAGHRTGEEVDLSFYRPSGVSKDLRGKIYDDLKKNHKIEMPAILWHVNDKPNPDPTKPPLSYAHFHVYLLGQKQFNKTPY